MGDLRVSLLGAFRVSVGDAALVAGGAKQRAVMALLALRVGEVVPESRLIDGVWGEATPNMVRNSLQVYVGHWRRVLAGAGCSATIERVGSGYRLTADPAVVDVVRMFALRERAQSALAEERFAVAADRFGEVLALWRGDALQDFVGMPFHQAESVTLEGARVQTLVERVDAHLGAGKGGEVVAELEALILAHPYEERFRAQLMHALYRAGRQVDALRACERARAELAEVGLEIGPGLRAMEQRVLQQDPELESRQSPFPPVGAPEPITSIVGREHDVTKVVDILADGDDRLVTLTGPGGVGKSRLALEVANRVQDEGWMPVAFVSVSETADRGLLETSVNTAFGVPVSWRERPVADIARMLGQMPVLVVLDGVEHVLESAGAVVGELLAQGRQVRVLATTRIPLGLPGERQFAVRPLRSRPADAKRDTDDVAGTSPYSSAVELFVDRAGRFSAGGDFDRASLAAIADICEEVDGLPLAIELAAARVGTLGVDGLRARLAERLDVVATSSRTGGSRHRSLREVIRWSHDLLGPGARSLLARLSVFSGDFSVEHAEAVATDGTRVDVLDAFEELDRHSLLARSTSSTGLPRFRLLRSVRDFAREQLEAMGLTQSTHRLLAEFISEVVRTNGGRSGAGAKQFDNIEADADNARGAVVWALESGDGDTAGSLCNLLYAWWMTAGRRNELLSWVKSTLACGPTDVVDRATLRVRLGVLTAFEGKLSESNVHLIEALNELPDSSGPERCQALLVLAENSALTGGFDRANELLAMAHDCAGEEEALQIRVAFSEAFVASQTSEPCIAVGRYRAVLAHPVSKTWESLAIKCRCGLGEALRRCGQNEEACRELEEALLLARESGDFEGMELAHAQLALTFAAGRQWPHVVGHAHAALDAGEDRDRDPECVVRVAIAILLCSPPPAKGATPDHLIGAAGQVIEYFLQRFEYSAVAFEVALVTTRAAVPDQPDEPWEMGFSNATGVFREALRTERSQLTSAIPEL